MAKLTYIPVRGQEVTASLPQQTAPQLVLGLEQAGWEIVLTLEGATILSDKTDRVVVH